MKLFGLHKSLTRQLSEFIPVAALLCLSVGCATPIGVSYVDRRVAYQSLTTNVLSTEKDSSFSARELINFNVYQEFEDNPKRRWPICIRVWRQQATRSACSPWPSFLFFTPRTAVRDPIT